MNTKQVAQLDPAGYFIAMVAADESPLEPGVFHFPAGCVDATAPVLQEGTRARWVSGVFEIEDVPTVPAPEPEPEPEPGPRVPTQVEMKQARLALLAVNKLHLVQPVIDSLPEPQRSSANIEWEYSLTVVRQNSLVSQIGTAIGLDAAAMDELFILAATL